MALGAEHTAGSEPAAFGLFAGLNEFGLAWFTPEFAFKEFGGD